MEKINTKSNIVFFGSPEFSICILKGLKDKNILPSLIITMPDRATGRKLKITPPPVKIWADKNQIPTIQPEKLDNDFIDKLKKEKRDLFLIAAYGKIIPQEILDIPKLGTLNVHPSLLPKYRGATPIHSVILNGEKETGVSIMLIDAKMDHGPIIKQEKISLYKNSISELTTKIELEKELAILGGKMLADIIPKWINNPNSTDGQGEIKAEEQNHEKATYCTKLKSDDGLIDLNDNPELNFKKIRAFDKWPRAHFFKNDKRIIIKKARLENGKLIIDRILPEGGKEIAYIK